MILFIKREYVLLLLVTFSVNCFFLATLFVSPVFSNEGIQFARQSAMVTINVSNEPMKNIVEMVSEQTGYRIEINEKLLDIVVSGKFKKMQMEDLFRRFLKDQNIFIVRDDEQKLIKIHTSKQTGKILVVGEGSSVDDQQGSYKTMLDSRDRLSERIKNGEVELELEPGVSFQAMLDSRDRLSEKVKQGEVELELEPGVSFQEMVESRDNLSETIVMDNGAPYQSMLSSRDRLEESIKNGKVELELEPGVSFQKMVESRDRFEDKVRSGEVTMTTDLSR